MISIAFLSFVVFLVFSPMGDCLFPTLSLSSDGKLECKTTVVRMSFCPVVALVGHEEGLDGILGGQDPVVGH